MAHKGKLAVISIIVVIVAIATGMFIYSGSDSVRVRHQLDLGEKYLSESNYEAAIVAYETVIEIDPMNVDAYLGLVDAYIGMGDVEAALDALQKGYELTGDEQLKEKLDSIQAEIDRIRQEEKAAEEAARLQAEEEQRRLEMERNTPDAVKQLYTMMDNFDEDEIVSFVIQNDIGTYKGAYAPSGDTQNGIVLEMFGAIDWSEFGYTGWRNSYNIYYGEKVDGSYETQGKWYVIWGMAEHITGKVEYQLYDGEWKNGKPNGNGKHIRVDENYGTYRENGVMVQEGYAMQKIETISAFYNGYVYGDYQQFLEWDIYNDLGRKGEDIRECKGTTNQKSEIIDGEYVKDKSTGQWKVIEGAVYAGWVDGFCWLCEDITWHDRLDGE